MLRCLPPRCSRPSTWCSFCAVDGVIFSNDASFMRLIGAVLFEQNDEWQTSRRYMMVEAFAQIDKEEIAPILIITTKTT